MIVKKPRAVTLFFKTFQMEMAVLKCVTQHPGFNVICLEKWNPRMAAERLKTKDKRPAYRQTGS